MSSRLFHGLKLIPALRASSDLGDDARAVLGRDPQSDRREMSGPRSTGISAMRPTAARPAWRIMTIQAFRAQSVRSMRNTTSRTVRYSYRRENGTSGKFSAATAGGNRMRGILPLRLDPHPFLRTPPSFSELGGSFLASFQGLRIRAARKVLRQLDFVALLPVRFGRLGDPLVPLPVRLSESGVLPARLGTPLREHRIAARPANASSEREADSVGEPDSPKAVIAASPACFRFRLQPSSACRSRYRAARRPAERIFERVGLAEENRRIVRSRFPTDFAKCRDRARLAPCS